MKSLKHLLLYDLKRGILTNWFKYLLLFLVSLVSAWSFGKEYLPYLKYELITHKASIWDFLAFDFWGIEALSQKRDLRSDIPVLWLIIVILICVAVGFYMHQQMYGYGRNILLKCKSRIQWWISKCLWCMITVALSMICILFAALICGFVTGLQNGGVSWDIMEMIKNVPEIPYTGFSSVVLVFFLPLIILSAIALWQQVLAMVMQPLAAMLIAVGYYLAASFYQSPLLLGNYLMICRNEYITTDGWRLSTGLIVGILANALAIIVGSVIIKKKDFLNKEQL